jgi:hypothetical protein
MPTARRFPTPWSIEEHNDASFIVKDATGQAPAYFLFRGRAGSALGGEAADQRRGSNGRMTAREAGGVRNRLCGRISSTRVE